MIIGCPKEIKNHEYRVGITPDGAFELKAHGHHVLIQTNAGTKAGFPDEMYREVGAEIVHTAEEVFEKAEVIVKVKEPLAEERKMLTSKHLLYTYMHLASDPKQIEELLKTGCTAIAYETVTDNHGKLPLLAPMSAVAGRMSIQVGMSALEASKGGCGKLLGGVPGVEKANVVVLGGGVVGENAAKTALGVGAKVSIFDVWQPRLQELDSLYGPELETIIPSKNAIAKAVANADMVVGTVLVTGGKTPKLVTREMLKTMRKGSVLVDVAIDHGGCFETSKPTTHDNPIYELDGIIHYCVPNMPGAVAQTSTKALANATLPHLVQIANKGWKKAVLDDKNLKNGVNIIDGFITHPEVHRSQPSYPYKHVDEMLH